MTKRSKRTYSKNFYIAKAIALAMFPLVLLLMPANTFDSGPEICIFTLLSGLHCPGCGMTRACMHIIHFDFVPALGYNKMAFIVLPVLCGLLVAEFVKTWKKIKNYHPVDTTKEAQV